MSKKKLTVYLHCESQRIATELPDEDHGSAVVVYKKANGTTEWWGAVCSSSELAKDLLTHRDSDFVSDPERLALYPNHQHVILQMECVSWDELISIFESMGFRIQKDTIASTERQPA